MVPINGLGIPWLCRKFWFPAKRNPLEEAYLNGLTTTLDADIIPAHEEIPKLLNKVYPINEIVEVDYYIPGCPPMHSIFGK